MTAAVQWRQLADEGWGQRFGRARKEAELSQEGAAELISRVFPIDATTLGRYEKLPALPASKKVQQVVAIALAIYGFNPADWGVELPPFWTAERVLELVTLPTAASLSEQGKPHNRCSTPIAA